MSLPRPASAAAMSMFRFASAPAPQLRHCAECSRFSASLHKFRQPSRRHLQTATAYRPYTLEQSFPPPRNTGGPDTSIAKGFPPVDKKLQNLHQVQHQHQHQPQTHQHQTSSLREVEAQKSQQVDTRAMSTSAPAPAPAAAKPRRSKLRPRKAAMTLSAKAVQQLKGLLDQPEPKLIRVGVKNRGCSGLAYHLEYVDKPGAFDETVEQEGVKVLIDSKALFSIIGSEMDWVEDKLNERFIFKNPNITEQCGCGESFSIS